nr:Holliday junction resolvase RuvX [Maliibacterium massiliense]
MRILCLDVGDVRIGVSVSDPFGWTAQPLETYTRAGLEADIAHIDALLRAHQATRLLVGLPRRLDGSLGEQAQKTRAFIEAGSARWQTPVVYWDERMTTQSARRTLIEGGVRRRDRKKVIDKIAAVYILQNYLDAQGCDN